MNDPLTLVCPNCLVSNRVPVSRMEEGPRCGRCHTPLYEGSPVDMDEAQLRAFQQRNQVPLLVDFWAEWCGPCKQMAPAFAAAAGRLEPWVRLAKVDTQACQTLATQYGIRGIPTMILFQGEREVARQSGAMNQAAIVSWVESVLPVQPA